MITLDLETRSYADLKKVGAWAYSEHGTTEVICAAYGIEDAPIQAWWPEKALEGVQAWPEQVAARHPLGHVLSDFMPYDLFHALHVERMPVEAHNVAFERSMWINVLSPEHGWILPEDDQWRDTMAVCSYYSLPQALDKVCRVLGYEGKDREGTRLISKYSKLHLKTASEHIPEEDFFKFVEYCKQDVRLEQEVSDFLGDLPGRELEIFLLDQEINLRGMFLDANSIYDAMVIVEERSQELKQEFQSITGYSPSQHDKVKSWMHEHGCPVENLQADYIDEVLDGKHDFIPSKSMRRVLELRKQFNRASTKKLEAMLRNRGHDGRARFQTRYHGAGTGRWTGTGFQPLNLSRGFEDVPPERLVTDLSHRSAHWLDVMYGDAMEAVGKASRHHIRATPGTRILAGDFVSIEAVVLSCLAGEEWKIEAFRRGDPVYEIMGCQIHNLPESAIELARADKKAFKNKYPDERFDGKTGELAFGYQGALGAWRNFDPERSSKHTDERVIEICRAWRNENPAIVQYWRDLDNAAVRCVRKNTETHAGKISFDMIDGWLSMRLPNGKRIWYWDPQLRLTMPKWHQPDEKEDCAAGTCDCEPRHQLTYMAQKEGQWKRVYTYGGKLAENATQATSREILVPAMLRLRKYGYPIILSVYDEVVSEREIGKGSIEEYAEIMRELPRWAEDYPISVDAWEGERYKK